MHSTIDLPRGDSPTLALCHPTEEEKLVQFKLNGAEWRGALSLPAYLRREATLSEQALTKDGGISYWILVDTALGGNPLDPTSRTRLPLASCEIYRKQALVWQDGCVREVITYGIGSVFCAPGLRKRGYAQRMMQELSKVLRTHQTNADRPSLFSVLYSDIGKRFYNQLGWEPFNSSHISLPAGVIEGKMQLPTTRKLHATELPDLCEIDVRLLRENLGKRPSGSRTAVALLPDIETIQWHHAREDFVGVELHGQAPTVKGAIVGAEIGKRVWCYWTRMWYNDNPAASKGNTLHILRLVIEDGAWQDTSVRGRSEESVDFSHDIAIAALFAAAQQEAIDWKMDNVEIWNPAPETLSAARRLDPNARVVVRDEESIASLQWFPAHDGFVADKIDWIGNEKYGWC